MLDFVRICLHKNTSQRPDSSMLSSHSFIRQDVAALRDWHANPSGPGGLPALQAFINKMGSKVDSVLADRAGGTTDSGKQVISTNGRVDCARLTRFARRSRRHRPSFRISMLESATLSRRSDPS